MIFHRFTRRVSVYGSLTKLGYSLQIDYFHSENCFCKHMCFNGFIDYTYVKVCYNNREDMVNCLLYL